MIELAEPTITTPRLTLRPWRQDDLPAFAQMNADPQVMKYMFKMLDRRQSDEAAEKLAAHFARHGFGKWAIEAPGVAPFVGCVGTAQVSYQTPAAPCVEIGWRMAFDYWGRGYATEAARAALEFGFTKLKLDEIVSFTVPANQSSWMLMERLGMTRSPDEDFNHPLVAPDHPLSRHMLFRLKRTEWESNQQIDGAAKNPQFGRHLEGRQYIVRPGSYALIRNSRGQIAIIDSMNGIGLPGGGADAGETPAQTLHRELREECGCEIVIERELGFATDFVHSTREGNFEKRCTFFEAHFDGHPDEEIISPEPGTRIIWLSPADARQVLSHESHRWAIAHLPS
jgi:ribosomal-protein-alanine N-acetyltransferase